MLIGYARISTGKQDLALQLDALQAAGCERSFKDTASGAMKSRPELETCLGHLRAGTHSSSGDWTVSAARRGISSRPSPSSSSARSDSSR